MLLLATAGLVGCDDPVPGPVGSVVLVVRTEASDPGSRFAEVEQLRIVYGRIVAVVRDEDGHELATEVDSVDREVVLRNATADIFVAQLQVPVGELQQLRIFPRSVTMTTTDGSVYELDPESSDLPSWSQTGWKIVSSEGDFTVSAEEPLGVRALFDFDDRLVLRGRDASRAKVKPTAPATAFQVNPPDAAPGVFIDEITVVFREGVGAAEAEAVAAEIGATVIRRPQLGTAYRFQLPPTTNLEEAYRFFGGRRDVVQGVLPATNWRLDQATPDIRNDAQDDIDVVAAWDTVHAALGRVGDQNVRVAIIDTGIVLDHPELYLNIAINQGELPLALFDLDGANGVEADEIAFFDTDGDGVIGFRDLNALRTDPDPVRRAVVPVDRSDDDNDYIDALDLLADVGPDRWVNSVNEDGFLAADDLVGWDFIDGDNDPSEVERFPGGVAAPFHGTQVAQVVGGIGDNGTGSAGLAWNVSIIPLLAARFALSPDDISVPNDTFFDAARYADSEQIGADIVLVASGWSYVRKGEDLDLRLVPGPVSFTGGIAPDAFREGVELGIAAFRVPPWVPEPGGFASRSLYVLSAGDGFLGFGSEGIARTPTELLGPVIPDHVVTAGAARVLLDVTRNSSRDAASNYGPEVLYANDGWEVVDPSDGILTGFGRTSSAAAQVAGASALYLSLFPAASGRPDVLRRRLFDSARPTVEVYFDPDFRVIENGAPFLDVGAMMEVGP